MKPIKSGTATMVEKEVKVKLSDEKLMKMIEEIIVYIDYDLSKELFGDDPNCGKEYIEDEHKNLLNIVKKHLK